MRILQVLARRSRSSWSPLIIVLYTAPVPVFLVTGVLVQDVEVAVQLRDDEAQVQLTDYTQAGFDELQYKKTCIVCTTEIIIHEA